MLIIGELRYSMQILNKVSTKDEYGAETSYWNHLTTLRCNRKFIGGDKTMDNKEIFNSQRVVFTTLYRKLNESNRILFEGKKYTISSIAEIGYKEGLQIQAELINE